MKKVILTILLFWGNLHLVFSQITEDQIKASMLYLICEYIEWPKDKTSQNFSIGILGNKASLYNELKLIAQNKKQLKGKNIGLQSLEINNIPSTINVLWVPAQFHEQIETLLKHCQTNSILMVTEELDNKVFSVINIYFNPQKQSVNFEVNKQNLILSKFNYRDELLLYGGNIIDVKELYQSTQSLLEEETRKVNKLSGQILEKDKEIESKNRQILSLNTDIEKSKRTLTGLADSIANMTAVITIQANQIEQKRSELFTLNSGFEKISRQKTMNEKKVKDKEAELKILDSKIKERENIISRQSENIEQKESEIKKKNQVVFILTSLGIVVLTLSIFLFWAYRTKINYNKILSTKVELRTRELNKANVELKDEIEKRIQFEEELKKSERNYREIFNSVSDFIVIQDPNGSVIDVNNPMLLAFGYSKEEIVKLSIGDLSSEEDGYTNSVANEKFAKVREKGFLSFDWLSKAKDGRKFWTIVTLTTTNIGGDDRVMALVRDNDENKRNEIALEQYRNNLEKLVKEKTDDLESANEELKSTNEELFDKNEIISNQNSILKSTLQHLQETQSQLLQAEKMASLGVLTAGVAHEINNPLNYIQGASLALEKHFEETGIERNQQTDFLFKSIKEGVERASKIVQGLNQFSRKSRKNDEKCDLHTILDNCLMMLNNQIKHRIVVERSYKAGSYTVLGNVGKLHQVFLNILTNASQAIASEGKITLTTGDIGNSVRVEIRDSGEGISEENLSRITDPFFTTKEPGKGTGLGLSITYNIIQEHNGKLEFESDPGKGTLVRVILPVNALEYEGQA